MDLSWDMIWGAFSCKKRFGDESLLQPFFVCVKCSYFMVFPIKCVSKHPPKKERTINQQEIFGGLNLFKLIFVTFYYG